MSVENSIEDIEYYFELCNLMLEDYQDVKVLMDDVYCYVGGVWLYKNFKVQVNMFFEGQICIEDKGIVVVFVIFVIVDYDQFGDKYFYDEIIGDVYLIIYDLNGDVLYGVEVIVLFEY